MGFLLSVLFESGSRLYWTLRYPIPFFSDHGIIYRFYPALRSIEELDISRDDSRFDILILGGSVVNHSVSRVERILFEELAYQTKRRIRITNLAYPAFTSLDSYYQYSYLSEQHFDIVLFYHGINETRANNCPVSIYRSDYSHYSWYRKINCFEKHKDIYRWITFPYTVYYTSIRVKERLFDSDFIPKHRPRETWTEHGSSIKTNVAFQANLEKILDIAEARGEPVILMSFTYYVPGNYTFERFIEKSLDYTIHSNPIELWGEPDNVVAGIEAHNTVLPSLAENYDNVFFIDQNNNMPKSGKYFTDICHFTVKGAQKFVDNILPVIIDRL